MDVKLYSGGVGINNKVVPHRLVFGNGGVSALEDAVDVLIDRTGEIVTRRGTALVVSGSFHSRFSLGDGSFYVVEKRVDDSALFRAISNADGTVLDMQGIISGMPVNAKMDFVEVGSKIYYCNGYQNGVLENDVSSPWTEQDWTGTDTSVEMVKPPAGSHIDFLSGRALLAVKDELFYTEHGLVGLVDEAKNRVRMEGDIIMVYAVQTGAYISDTKAVYFVSGINPNEWLCKKVLNYPAIEWGREQGLVDPSQLGMESFALSALFATTKGTVIGFPDGTAVNLIDKVLTMPDCSVRSGSLMVVDETTIIQSTGE